MYYKLVNWGLRYIILHIINCVMNFDIFFNYITNLQTVLQLRKRILQAPNLLRDLYILCILYMSLLNFTAFKYVYIGLMVISCSM